MNDPPMVLKDVLNYKLRSSRASGACSRGLLGLILEPFWELCWNQVGIKMVLCWVFVLRSVYGHLWKQLGPNIGPTWGPKRPQNWWPNLLKRGLKMVLGPNWAQDGPRAVGPPPKSLLRADLGPNMGPKRAHLGLKMSPRSANQANQQSIHQSINISFQQPYNHTAIRSSVQSTVAGWPKAIG